MELEGNGDDVEGDGSGITEELLRQGCSLKPVNTESDFLVIQQEESSLSNKDLVELLREVLAKGSSLRLRVRGFSMFPLIRENDMVTVSPLKNCSVSYVGLPVAFLHPQSGKLVIHRVIRQRQGTFVTKGDCALGIDGFIPAKNILGCVTKAERNNRRVRFGVGSARGLAVLLNKTNVFYALCRIGTRLPSVMRRFIKHLLFA